MNNELILSPIAIIHTPYNEKFSVPRQPELVPDGKGIIELLAPYNTIESVRGLEQFSHLWLIFQFDRINSQQIKTTVRPPRLGGNSRVGVFASRATHRPNPIGLSKVKLEKIVSEKGKVFLYLGSVDLVDQTPILDIKPYLPYADSELEATAGFATEKPSKKLIVQFSNLAQQQLNTILPDQPHFQRFITDVIAQDPRPAYRQGKTEQRIYGISLANFNIRWQVTQPNQAIILSIDKLKD